jgi:NAD(P)-dependent dehydrogenase (short-subunit alcohol dehydrogenase family)
MQCQGRVAVVTGAAGNGIGRSIALTLAREGAAVAINYRTSQQAAEKLATHIRNQGGIAAAIQGDVFTSAGCDALIAATQEQLGPVEICIIGPGGGWHPEPPDQLDPAAALDDIIHEAAPSLYLLARVLPDMYAQNWGRIVGISTNPALPSPAYAYNVAKAARDQVLLQAHRAAWEHHVTVNVVAPGPVGPIETLDEAIEQCAHGAAWQKRTTTSPQDIAENVAWLCSDAGRFITGALIPFEFTR